MVACEQHPRILDDQNDPHDEHADQNVPLPSSLRDPGCHEGG